MRRLFFLRSTLVAVALLCCASSLAAQKDRPSGGAPVPRVDNQEGRAVAISNTLKRSAAAELRDARWTADASAEAALNAVAERAAGRVASSGASREQVRAAEDAMEQLVMRAVQAGAARQPGGRGGTLSGRDVNSALTALCPFYPIC